MRRSGRFRLPSGMVKLGLTGGLVAAVAFGSMTLLLTVLDLPGQLALAITCSITTTLHFSLNRQWVWHGDGRYALHLSAQGRRYLTLVAVSYGVTAAALAWLPGWFDVPELGVYFATTMVIATLNYFILRHWIFGRVTAPAPTLPAA